MPKIAAKSEVYVCKYCNKTFKREKSLVVHLCEKKKRWQSKDEKGVRIGFNAYLKFYEYTQHSVKKKSHMDFIQSPYYNAFVKFGRYCVEINAINIPRFTEYVVEQNKKLDYWTSDKLYSEYLNKLLVTENPLDALTRAIKYSMKWAEKYGVDSKDILQHGNTNEICYAITTGKLSAWVLYNCDSGNSFLENLNKEQTHLIWDFINPEIWGGKFRDAQSDCSYIKQMLKQAGW